VYAVPLLSHRPDRSYALSLCLVEETNKNGHRTHAGEGQQTNAFCVLTLLIGLRRRARSVFVTPAPLRRKAAGGMRERMERIIYASKYTASAARSECGKFNVGRDTKFVEFGAFVCQISRLPGNFL